MQLHIHKCLTQLQLCSLSELLYMEATKQIGTSLKSELIGQACYFRGCTLGFGVCKYKAYANIICDMGKPPSRGVIFNLPFSGR